MPRVPPITGKRDVPAEFHPVVDDVLSVFGQIRGPFSMLLHSPPLAERMLQFVKFNRGGTVVEPRLLSHAILASVRERDAHYVWAAQVGAARRGAGGDDRPAARQGRSRGASATSSSTRGSWCATTGSTRRCSTDCRNVTGL